MQSTRCAATRGLALLLSVATGCSYVSSYVPPDSWRARPIYSGNEVIALGIDTVVQCADEVIAEEDLPMASGPPPEPMVIDNSGYWAPPLRIHLGYWGYYGGYYGGWGLRPPVFLSGPTLLPGPMHGGRHLGPGFGNLLNSLGGADSDGAGYLFAILLGIGILVSSGIAVGFAAAPAEAHSVSDSIDQINIHNDQMRYKIAECDERARTAVEVQP